MLSKHHFDSEIAVYLLTLMVLHLASIYFCRSPSDALCLVEA